MNVSDNVDADQNSIAFSIEINKQDLHYLQQEFYNDLTIILNYSMVSNTTNDIENIKKVNIYYCKLVLCRIEYFKKLISFNGIIKDTITLDLNYKTIIMLINYLEGKDIINDIYFDNIIELWEFAHEILEIKLIKICYKFITTNLEEIIKHFDFVAICQKIVLYFDSYPKKDFVIDIRILFSNKITLLLNLPNLKDLNPEVLGKITYGSENFLKLLVEWAKHGDNINNISKVKVNFNNINLNEATKIKDIIVKSKDLNFIKSVLIGVIENQ